MGHDEEEYRRWMADVETVVREETGQTTGELSAHDWRGYFRRGVDPEEAAMEALELDGYLDVDG